jgi:hypothetical protein
MASLSTVIQDHDLAMTGLIDLEPHLATGGVDEAQLNELWAHEARINDVLAQADAEGAGTVEDSIAALARELRLQVEQTLAAARAHSTPRRWSGGWVLGAAATLLTVSLVGLGIKVAQGR